MTSGYNNFARDQYNSAEPYQNPYQFPQERFNQEQYRYNQYQATDQSYEEKHSHVGDFTPFYIVITICTIIGFGLFILNIALGCCSRYSQYWNDRHTGNRWIVSLWTATPHKQPALDYGTELEEISSSQHQVVYHHPHGEEERQQERTEFLELRTKRESEI